MEDQITHFLALLGGDRNILSSPDNHRGAPQRIAEDLRKDGIPAEVLEFTHHGILGQNLWIPPKDPSSDFILILAHHDTVPESPGVDDNGSGMLVTYLLARWYHSSDIRDLNLAFCMPDYEEGDPRVFLELENFNKKYGTSYSYKDDYFNKDFWREFTTYLNERLPDITGFSGTKNMIAYLQGQQLLERLKFVIDFETVGYRSEHQDEIPGIPLKFERGDFLAGAINEEAGEIYKKIMSLDHPLKRVIVPVPNHGLSVPDTRRSDHSVFWDRGIDAVMFSDTANFRNPHYHKPSDTEIDYDFILEIVSFSKELLKIL